MAENNNNGGKNTNIITKINDTISKVLGDFPPVVQTIAKIVVFGGLILLIAKAIGYIFPVVVNVLFELLRSSGKNSPSFMWGMNCHFTV